MVLDHLAVHPTGITTADHVYVVVWASSFLMSTLWTECPMVVVGLWYGQLQSTNTIGFYRSKFECTEIPCWDPEPRCRSVYQPPSPHVLAWYCTSPCRNDLYTIPGIWKLPSSSMAYILTRHVTHWACWGCSGSTCTMACSANIQQL
jgi:hypothetical protein